MVDPSVLLDFVANYTMVDPKRFGGNCWQPNGFKYKILDTTCLTSDAAATQILRSILGWQGKQAVSHSQL